MAENNNLLISGVGGPTPRSIARSLHLSQHPVTLYGTDVNPYAYGVYEDHLYQETRIIPYANHEGYWDALFAYVKERNIQYAMVHPEHEVLAWAKRKHDGLDWPCPTLLPHYNLVHALVDKGRMTQLLADTDLVPNSYLIDSENLDFEDLEQQLPYPFWIRATAGSSGLGSLKVGDRHSLKNWMIINPNVEQFIASSFLPGRNLGCKLLYHNGDLLRSACGERVNYIMSKVAPSGITGNTSFGRLLNEPHLVAQATKALDILFEKTNTPKHGFFTVDFKEDQNGHPYITEINVRMVAFNYIFAKAGANFSSDILQLLNGDTSFDRTYKMYEFEPGTIFLRDVDAEPILMNERDLKLQ